MTTYVGTLDNDTGQNTTDNRFYGLDGDDFLDSGYAGFVTMYGGDGNDTMNFQDESGAYGDMYGGAGNDSMDGSENENLYDDMYGEEGNDTAFGYAGQDTLDGGQGDDVLHGGDDSDDLWGVDGSDTLYGDAGTDYLDGGRGNDILDGGTGADYMTGGQGGDTYTVDDAGDIVVETTGDGDWSIDTVNSSVTFNASTSAAGVEEIVLTGSNAINVLGNAMNNVITGNVGNNGLNGGAGADVMNGSTGNDTYTVDNAGDVVTELSGEGTDSVRSTVNYTLGAYVENLTLQGTASIYGIGNDAINTIVGNSAANIIAGKGGADMLTGGAGNDTFDYNSITESSYSAYDRITDLTNGDKIDLSGIDANSGLAGNQAFSLVNAFTNHAGEMTLKYDAAKGFTVLAADVNGDGTADMRIVINGDHHTFTNFVF